MVELQCPSCEKRLRLPKSAAGKRVRCPGCTSVVRSPSGDSDSVRAPSKAGAGRIAARCPHCRATLRMPAGAAGKQVQCPKCQQGFKAKATASPAASVPKPIAAASEPFPGAVPLDDFPLTDADFNLPKTGGNLPAGAPCPPGAAGGESSAQTASRRGIYALPATLTVVVGSINLLGFLGLAILSLVLSLLTFNLVGVVVTVLVGATAVTTGVNTILGGVNILRMIDRRHGIWAGRMLLIAPFFGLAFCAWRINLILGLIVFVAVLGYSWPVGWWMMLLLERKKAIADFGELSDEELMAKFR